ncbi:MAG: twin-arginine translocase TatA/TatE family subunit [Nitrospirota bacterium]
MFGTMGFSELVIILVIVLILFGSSRLPALGEGVGKALRGFKKAVHEEPPPLDPNAPTAGATPPIEDAHVVQQAQGAQAPPPQATTATAATPAPAAAATGGRMILAAYQPGSEATPGTTAALMASAAPQAYQPKQSPAKPAAPAGQPAPTQGYPSYQPPTMEDRAASPAPTMRAQYPPLPPTAQTKPQAKRASAIVNKDAVARVQAQQAALKAKAAQPAPASSDMPHFGEGLGDALRTFRQAVNDVRSTVDPQMRTIQAEIDAAQKEIEQTVEDAKQMPSVQEEPPKQA